MEYLLLSATGRLARATLAEPYPAARAAQSAQPRAAHDVIRAGVPTDTPVAAVTSAGRAVLVTPADLPEINPGAWSLADAPAAAAVLGLAADETVVTLAAADPDGPPLALGTVQGVVKRVVPEYKGWAEWEVIALKDGDRVVGAGPAADADELVFVTSDAQLLRTAAREARAQGRAAGGMAGVKLAEGARVLWFGTVAKAERDAALVATLATGPRPDAPWTAKVTPFAQFPAKGRATGGVRCHRFLKDQDHLALAWVGLPPARACDADGNFRNLPATDDRRDGTGTKVYASFAHLG